MEETKALRRLQVYGDIPAGELWELSKLANQPRSYRPKSVIQRQGDHNPQLFLLHDGWAISHMLLKDGSRQITKVHFPGDVMGTPSLPFDRAVETFTCLNDAVVSTLDKTSFGNLLTSHPKIAIRLYLIAQEERLTLVDRLASVARMKSGQRLAALLLHVMDKTNQYSKEVRSTFSFPLTQDTIADLLGLTPVHVNRSLRELTSLGHISYSSSNYTIHNEEALRAFVGIVRRQVASPHPWLTDQSST